MKKDWNIRKEQLIEVIPGFITWLVLLSPFWLTIISPESSFAFITFVFVYIGFISLLFVPSLLIGYFKRKIDDTRNWRGDLEKISFSVLPDQASIPKTRNKLPFFVCIIPCINDPISVLKDTVNSVISSDYPLQNILVVFTLENADPNWAKNTKRKLEKIYTKKINLLVTIHKQEKLFPKGGGTNRRWGALQAELWLKKKRIPIDSALLMTFDPDTILTPKFFPAIAHKYLTTEKRKQRFYTTASLIFDNNYERANLFSRIHSSSLTLNTLSFWQMHPFSMETFSIYAINMHSMKQVGYWNPYILADDSTMSIRMFLYFNGEFEGRAVYTSVNTDCVEGSSFIGELKSLYRQQRRWGWGAVDETNILISGILRKFNKIPLKKLVPKVFLHFFRINIATASVFLLTFGIAVAKLVISGGSLPALAVNLTNVAELYATALSVAVIPVMWVKYKLFHENAKGKGLSYLIGTLLEGPLVTINVIMFYMLPYLEAQTLPLFNRRLDKFQNTQKFSR